MKLGCLNWTAESLKGILFTPKMTEKLNTWANAVSEIDLNEVSCTD